MNEDGFLLPAHGDGALASSKPGVRRKPPCELDILLRAALDGMHQGILILDRRLRVQLVSRVAAQMLGVRSAGRAVQLPVLQFLATSRLLDSASLQTIAAAFDGLEGHEPREVLLSVPRADGSRVIALHITRARQLGWAVTLEDVTQSRQTQDWLLEHVSSDPVTGLWNRQHFMLMLRDRLDSGDIGGIAVLLVNLRRFKIVNETLGTDAGDAVLRLVGSRLGGFLREDDMLARFAGDEFAIMVSFMATQDSLDALCERLTDLLSRPYLVEGQLITIGANIGVARAPGDGVTADILVANAAMALSAAHAGPGSGHHFFEPKLTEQARQRRHLEADLRRALPQDEFELFYQPQVDLRQQVVTGLEALIRWRRPGKGIVPPGDFIALAEEIGLIGAIGDWVLQNACQEASNWPDDVAVAVNASPLQFETGDFARKVAHALATSRLPAHRLEIEITESLLLRDTGTVVTTLNALHDMGVRLVLDDFGTGYASLSQLSRFHFDKIKIDRSFVSPPLAAAEHGAIVRSIAALGQSLGIPTTAEGVETVAQLERMREDGCTCVQGFYLSRPVPAEAVGALLVRLNTSALAAAQ